MARGRRRAAVLAGTALALLLAATPAAQGGRFLELTTAYGTRFDAYAAGPEEAAVGVLLLHDRWGLTESVRRAAEQLAEAGFRTLAIDLFDGRRPESRRRAEEVYRQVDPVWVEADVTAALEHLRRPGRRLAVIGWGYGADRAWTLLARHAGAASAPVEAAVLIEPSLLPADAETLGRLPDGLLVLLAEGAALPTASEVRRLEEEAMALGRAVVLRRLPGGSGFSEPREPGYDPRLAREALEAARAFLTWRLGGARAALP